ncbi:MAG: menaquinone biosynthesis protein [Candidatus Baltobacteraceae bacterium]
MNEPLRVGRISYTNDLPIYRAFDEGAVTLPGTLVAGVPAALNAALLEGRLDLSPVSTYFYALHADRFALLPHLCIGSRQDVWSVLLVSPHAPEALDGARIAVTAESASGRALLRILLERRYGVRAEFVEVVDPLAEALQGEPTLLIGDRALDARRAVPPVDVYDLGALWHAWTGLDMVFAVWAVRRDVLESRGHEVAAALDALLAARAWGEANPERVVAAAEAQHPRDAGFYAAYYAALKFAFDGGAQAGLVRFFEEAVAIGALRCAPSAVPEGLHVAR